MKHYFAILLLCMIGVGCAESESAGTTTGLADALGLGQHGTLDEGIFYGLDDLFETGVQVCMKAEGFEYQSQPGASSFGRVGDDGTLTDEEYASEFGFGIWAGVGGSLPESSTDVPINDAYLAGLGESERNAWYEQSKVCMMQGYDEQDDVGLLLGPVFEAQTEIEELVNVDDRVLKAQAGWSECMASEGFAFETLDQLYLSLLSEGQRLAAGAPYADQVHSADDPEIPYPEGDAFGAQEVIAAQASFTCGADLQATKLAVRAELEEERLSTDAALRQAATQFRSATGSP